MYNEHQIKRQKSTGSESTDYPTLLASITARLQSVDQSHILAHLSDESIPESSKLSFLQSINEIPLENLASYLKGALEEEEKLKNFDPNNVAPEDVITPFDGKVASTTSTDADQRTALEEANKLGLESISKGQVAALLLAGGQGTRLGYDGPKGMYDIGMPSGRTLFQLMAERIKKLGELSGGGDKAVPFYIMTSPLNHQATTEYFAKHDNFGIDVTFFPQVRDCCCRLMIVPSFEIILTKHLGDFAGCNSGG